jgi:hypothetical protein
MTLTRCPSCNNHFLTRKTECYIKEKIFIKEDGKYVEHGIFTPAELYVCLFCDAHFLLKEPKKNRPSLPNLQEVRHPSVVKPF